jgi:fumarylpyruvate hydrolase
MTTRERRKLLQLAAAAGATALSGGAARAASATDTARSPFTLPVPAIPIVGSDQVFPVRRIYCIGRNYAAHALERGSDPTREPPFFFQKPSDAIQVAPRGVTIEHPYPPLTKNYHHEIELVAALDKGGRNLSPEQALGCVFGYAVGLDMTRRDLQNEMAAQKKPWEIGKSFDHSAIVGALHRVADVGQLAKGSIWLKINGQPSQESDLAKMIWSVAEQISQLSASSELHPGDIVYSGTPDRVGPVVVGDVMTGHIDGLYDISVKVV